MSKASKKKKVTKRKKYPFTKKFQTELQSLVAYGVYDSEEILGAGSSSNVSTLVERLRELYFPPNNPADERVSHVENRLERNGKYLHLFEEGDNGKPTINEKLHRSKGKEIYVGKGCIDLSMLTRKNLTNMADISVETLWRHAKEVEKNAKKALSLCVSEDSPYRDYNGTFPSGHNWDSYIEWVRQEMYSLLETELEEDSDDPDGIPSTVSGEDDGADVEDTGNDETNKAANDVNEGEKDNTDGASKIADGISKDDENADPTYIDIDDDEVPDDWYFKGFLVFALWGFIPAPGGEKYKSILMQGSGNDHSKNH